MRGNEQNMRKPVVLCADHFLVINLCHGTFNSSNHSKIEYYQPQLYKKHGKLTEIACSQGQQEDMCHLSQFPIGFCKVGVDNTLFTMI
jgi:hypothetical protein